jgi:hypothetical protein
LSIAKRLLILAMVVSLHPSSAFPQESGKPVGESDLYYRALFASLDKMSKSWGNINDVESGGRVRTDYHNMIIWKNNEIAGSLPTQLGEYHVEYLDSQGLAARYKKLGKEFSILIAHPMKNEGERLEISFSVHWISYRKQSLIYALSDWCKVFFRYDCGKREFVVDEVKLGGI